MSALAQKHDAVNLGQGFPDYAIDPALIDLVDAAMRAGHNQYPLMPGVMRLREAIAAKVARLYGRAYDPEREVTVTLPGGKLLIGWGEDNRVLMTGPASESFRGSFDWGEYA